MNLRKLLEDLAAWKEWLLLCYEVQKLFERKFLILYPGSYIFEDILQIVTAKNLSSCWRGAESKDVFSDLSYFSW